MRTNKFMRRILRRILFGLIVIMWSCYLIHVNLIVRILLKLGKSSLVAGIYYGFPMSLSMGFAHLELLVTRVLGQGKKGIQETRAARLGFSAGKVLIFVSFYSTALYGPLAVAGPHIITVLGLPYLFITFFLTNHKEWSYYVNLNPVYVNKLMFWQALLKHIIIQLGNHAVFSNSVSLRLPTIFMFQCKSKIGFLLGICIVSLVGPILLMESLVFIFVWIHKNFIKSNRFIPLNSQLAKNRLVIELKHLFVDLRNRMDQVINICIFVFCLYSLGRIASPLFTIKLKNITQIKKKKEGDWTSSFFWYLQASFYIYHLDKQMTN